VIKWTKVLRAVLGVLVVGVLLWVVLNWYGQYQTAASNGARPATTQAVAPRSGIATGSAGTTYAIVKVNGVNFRVKPASSAKLIRGMKMGEKVTVLAKDGQWYQVKDAKGTVGWVTADADYVGVQAQ
jgi:N-acetylmuramoyl-L-alanine amidase